METGFNSNPVLNSPYQEPQHHWQLDQKGMPTGMRLNGRRPSFHIVPIPATQQQRRKGGMQPELELETETRENPIVNRVRKLVDEWRGKTGNARAVGPTTCRLLEYWRQGTANPKPFFCQLEAVETLIWLNEVASKTEQGRQILKDLEEANAAENHPQGRDQQRCLGNTLCHHQQPFPAAQDRAHRGESHQPLW